MAALLNPRLAELGEYPFPRLEALIAGVTPATNEPALRMSLGEPQHPPPALLAETLAANAHLLNRYPPNAGTPEFRAAVADWLARRYRLPPGSIGGLIDVERGVLPVAGTREALYMVSQLVVDPDAKRPPAVLLPNPYYQPYSGGGRIAGAEPVYLSATRATGFLPDLDAIPRALLERTALFFMCSPANPHGAVASLYYWKRAICLAREHGFVLACDECYSEIYTGAPPPGAIEAAAETGALDNLLFFNSLSKRSSVPGLRAGFVAGDPTLVQGFLRLRSFGNAGMPLPTQAAAAALYRDEAHVVENRAAYQRKFAEAERLLGGRHGYYTPAGGFFLWLEVGDGEAVARTLWREAGVLVLPGGYLAKPDADGANPGERYVRIALVHDFETTRAGLARIGRVLDRAPGTVDDARVA